MAIEQELPIVKKSSLKVDIYGLGGAGINTVFALGNTYSEEVLKYYFDTSKSNFEHRQGMDGPVHLLGSEIGSGGLRAENAFASNNVLASGGDELFGVSNISILVASASGASGSILLPYILRELRKRRPNSAVICMLLLSKQNQLWAENAKKTLLTLAATADDLKIDVPIMIVTNDFGRLVADETAQHRLGQLIQLQTAPAAEIDQTDRLHWLKPMKMKLGGHGLYPLHVTSGATGDFNPNSGEAYPGIDTSYIHTSALILHGSRSDNAVAVPSKQHFEGFLLHRETPLIGLLGSSTNIVGELLTELDRVIQGYKTAQSGPAAVDYATEERSDTGAFL
jgi:hypothetical protein